MWNKVATTKRHADKEIFGANAPKKIAENRAKNSKKSTI
jgi:hypothetical protein